MIELITSRIPPLHSQLVFQDVFFKLLSQSEKLQIATGYISEEAVVDLKKVLESNSWPTLSLTVGMHYLEGVTRSQYDALALLNDYLVSSNRGGVNLVNRFKFHGKLYNFITDGKPFASIVGSSNLTNIAFSSRNFEVDVLLKEAGDISQIKEFIDRLNNQTIVVPFNEWKPTGFIEVSQLDGHEDVDRVPMDKLSEVFSKRAGLSFKIPLKASSDHQKSNLNAFFGKGREDSRGFIRPRPWYEVELIVPKEITSRPGYPAKDVPFRVYTDNGWTFECNVNGDFSKNFRSYNDLTILGKWLKGKLESKGGLKMGTLVTEETLDRYGRRDFDLIATNDPLVWLLEF